MRRSRGNYALWFLSVTVGEIVFNLLMGIGNVDPELVTLIFIVYTIFCVWLASGRFKDMNMNPWWSLLTLLPFVSFIIMFIPGAKGENKYGEDPCLSDESQENILKVNRFIEKLQPIECVPSIGKVEQINFRLNVENANLFYIIPSEDLDRLRNKLEKMANQLEQNQMSYGHQYAERCLYIDDLLIFKWKKEIKF